MRHAICKIRDVPPEGEARAFPFFGREVQVWHTGERICATANARLKMLTARIGGGDLIRERGETP